LSPARDRRRELRRDGVGVSEMEEVAVGRIVDGRPVT